PIHVGGTHTLGEQAGSSSVILDTTQMPSHSHNPINLTGLTVTARGRNGTANLRSPVANVAAIESTNTNALYSSAAPDANMSSAAVALTGALAAAGSGVGHENRQPYLALNYCIALQGVFPSAT